MGQGRFYKGGGEKLSASRFNRLVEAIDKALKPHVDVSLDVVKTVATAVAHVPRFTPEETKASNEKRRAIKAARRARQRARKTEAIENVTTP